MSDIQQNTDNKEFISLLRQRAQHKVDELAQLEHDLHRIEVQIERTKAYVQKLNAFLESEEELPIPLKQVSKGTGVGKVGNRSKEFPVRKVQWEGMTMNEIVASILNASPNKIFQSSDIVPLVYEIQSDKDMRLVSDTTRSVMQKGKRAGLWAKAGYGKYKSKSPIEQGQLVEA